MKVFTDYGCEKYLKFSKHSEHQTFYPQAGIRAQAGGSAGGRPVSASPCLGPLGTFAPSGLRRTVGSVVYGTGLWLPWTVGLDCLCSNPSPAS